MNIRPKNTKYITSPTTPVLMNSFQQLHNLCTNNNITVSTAESCTAGLLSKKITAFSGSSFFLKAE